MTTRRIEVRGDAPADVVWGRYEAPARWPGWAPHIRQVQASTPRIEPGTTGVVRGPWPVAVRFRVLAVDREARTWAWEVHAGPVRLHLTHDVEPCGGGSRAGLAVTGQGPVVRAYAPVATWALRRLVRP